MTLDDICWEYTWTTPWRRYFIIWESFYCHVFPLKASVHCFNIHSVSKKFSESLLPLKIVAIHCNTRLTTFVQLPETISKGLLWNQSQKGYHMIFDGISHLQNVHIWWPPSSGDTGRSPQEPDQGRKEGHQAQLPSSKPGAPKFLKLVLPGMAILHKSHEFWNTFNK